MLEGQSPIVVNLCNRTEEEKGGQTLVCDKRDRAIAFEFCGDLYLPLIFSGLLQKKLFKER